MRFCPLWYPLTSEMYMASIVNRNRSHVGPSSGAIPFLSAAFFPYCIGHRAHAFIVLTQLGALCMSLCKRLHSRTVI